MLSYPASAPDSVIEYINLWNLSGQRAAPALSEAEKLDLLQKGREAVAEKMALAAELEQMEK